MDTGTLSKAQSETIRVLVWILSFLSFGYATVEFEVTAERLGVYRPEEHIDKFVALHCSPAKTSYLTYDVVPRITTTTKMLVKLIPAYEDPSVQLSSRSTLKQE